MDPNTLNGTALAYLGDAVLELLTRSTLLQSGVQNAGVLNKMASRYVRATVQSEAVERILPLLCEQEEQIYRRGRNAHGISAPKSASTAEYRRATGLEALFGYLFLTEQNERMRTLFAIAFPDADDRADPPT